jgi:hypothetical protein
MSDNPSHEKYEPCPATFIFVPAHIKTLMIVSFNSEENLEFIVSQPFGRQRHIIVPPLGGTLLCLCNMSRFFYSLFIQSQNRRYRQVRVRTAHVMLLLEQVWNPFAQTHSIPRLWDLSAINLLLQGYSEKDCSVLLESPLLTWRKTNFLIQPYASSSMRKAPFLTCNTPSHRLPWIAESTLGKEFWDPLT